MTGAVNNRRTNNMRTIRTKVYSFDELNEDAKQNAIENYRNNGIDSTYIYDDAYNSVKKFHEIFGTKEGNRSWLEISTNHIDDNVCNLTGLRLQKYIINNFGNDIHKGKYFSLWSKTDISYKYYKEGHPVLKSRYSKVMFENCCVLTGVCYDDSLLQPVYNFIHNYKQMADYYSYMDFETLMNACITSLEKDIEGIIDGLNEDSNIEEQITNNEYEFTKDGNIFHK